MNTKDTIAAISTPVGCGGIGVVRLSGDPLPIAKKMFESSATNAVAEPVPNRMYYGTVSADGFLEKGYMVYFKAPKSYTGEDVVEFQIHGGVRLTAGVLAECVRNGARPAERGEFTRRAFLNGKMALSDAEGVIDMINAESEAAVNAAFRLMTGKLSTEIVKIQKSLSDIITDLEAVMDYPEELESETLPDAFERIKKIRESLKKKLSAKAYGRYVKHGLNVALCGDTNVGKSSLLNAILGDDRAIVSDIDGTTRDAVSESVELDGIKVTFTDTAGMRETDDVIEQEGVKRAKNAMLSADLVLYVVDCEKEFSLAEVDGLSKKPTFLVVNKIDKRSEKTDVGGAETLFEKVFFVSAKTGAGIKKLLAAIVGKVKEGKIENGEIITNERQLDAVNRAYAAIDEACANYEQVSADCIVGDLRRCWSALGEITGETVSEKIIDNIFEKFCVGK